MPGIKRKEETETKTEIAAQENKVETKIENVEQEEKDELSMEEKLKLITPKTDSLEVRLKRITDKTDEEYMKKKKPRKAKPPKIEEEIAKMDEIQQVYKKADCTSITPGSKGFLISFMALQPGSEFCSQLVAEATALFESYSKKLDPPVDCYFREQKVGKQDESPIFIETDMADPVVLLHTVFEDLIKSGNREGVEKLSMCRIMPVHATWGVSLESEKGKYMTREEYASIEQEVNNYIDKYVEEGKGTSFQVQAWNRSIEKCITEHLLSRGAVRVAKDGEPDVVVYVKLYGAKVFCLSVLTDFAKYKDYNMKKILENKGEDMIPS